MDFTETGCEHVTWICLRLRSNGWILQTSYELLIATEGRTFVE